MHGNAAMGRKCVYENVKESKEAGATGHAQVGQVWGGAGLCSEEKGRGRKREEWGVGPKLCLRNPAAGSKWALAMAMGLMWTE